MDGCFHRLTPQFQMKFACFLTERIERIFDVTSPHTASELQSLQAVVGQTDQLVAVIAAGMTRRDFAVGNHAHLHVTGPNHHRCVL